MVLGLSKISKICKLTFKLCPKYYSTSTKIKKSVYISQSKDVFENLALENWLYHNINLKNHHVLLIWQNNPCVILGRHRNPWLDVENELPNYVQISRRSSGGKTVYQDNGYLNFTFFSSFKHFKQMHYQEIIKRAIFRKYNLEINICNNELFIRNEKVTESALKIGFPNAYHHCNIPIQNSTITDFKTKHKSVNKVWSLNSENSEITIDGMLSAVGWEFLRTDILTLEDKGQNEANKQKGFHMINPKETWFPGIKHIKDKLKSWEWRYGKTPDFKITRSLTIPENFLKRRLPKEDTKLKILVKKGIISEILFFIPPGLTDMGFTGEASVVSNLKGQKFNKDTLQSLMRSFGQNIDDNSDKEKTVIERMERVVTSLY